MKYYYLYKITNLVNGKIYIGVHQTDDLDDGYMGSGRDIQKAKEKYGVENFEKEVLKWFDNEEDMFNEEAEVVNEDFIKRRDTYNLCCGGKEGSWDFCNRHGLGNKKMQELYGVDWAKIIGKKGAESRNYWGKAFEGKQHSEEAKKTIGKKNSEHQQGSGNSQYGTCWIYHPELEENKKIDKNELQEWLSQGWYKGRKMKFHKK